MGAFGSEGVCVCVCVCVMEIITVAISVLGLPPSLPSLLVHAGFVVVVVVVVVVRG